MLDGRGGWYRWNKRDTVDDYLNLDINRIVRSVDLDQVSWRGWHWEWSDGRKASIQFRVQPGRGLELHYQYDGEKVEPYLAPIVTTTPHYGGLRYWFRCPNQRCGRRVRTLYGGRHFLCRQCHNLAYATQQAGDRKARQIAIYHRLLAVRRKLGNEGGSIYDPLTGRKPARMHWRTYWRLLGEHDELKYLDAMAMIAGLPTIVGMESSDVDDNAVVDHIWQEYKRRKTEPEELIWRGLLREAEDDPWLDDDESRAAEQSTKLTLGELAAAAGVPYAFAKECVAEGLLRADAGRTQRAKRYRRRLASWVKKLYELRAQGLSWAEIQAWTKRRWQPGHEHERRWPAGVTT